MQDKEQPSARLVREILRLFNHKIESLAATMNVAASSVWRWREGKVTPRKHLPALLESARTYEYDEGIRTALAFYQRAEKEKEEAE